MYIPTMGSHKKLLVICCLLILTAWTEGNSLQNRGRPFTGYIAYCDFNDNTRPLCDWKQHCEGQDHGDWIRAKSSTPSHSTGPDGDYPDGNGYYLYQEATNLIPNDAVRLDSPKLDISNDVCVEFWYHMSGSETQNELRVLILDEKGQTVYWKQTGAQSSNWLYGYFTYQPKQQTSIQVLFVAVRGLTEYGDTAIDNIGVKNGPCVSVPDSTTPPVEPPGTCIGYGDPHFVTFDGYPHTFMGNCTYTLTKLCEVNSSLTDFNVEVAHEYRGGNTQVSYVSQVMVDVHGYIITLEKEKVVKLNGEEKLLPLNLSPGISVGLSGQYVAVITDFGLMVKYDGDHRVEVTLSKAYQDKVCGICANFNGQRSDDTLNPNGIKEPNSESYGNSWQVQNNSSCSLASKFDPQCTEEEQREIESHQSCGIMLPFDGVFQHCHLIVDPRPYFLNCYYDMCALHLDPNTLCRHLQAYADACQAAGAIVLPWRNATFCPLSCPANSHYEQCGTSCPATCLNPGAPSNCNLPCSEGCVCDPGYVLYNNKCVPSNQCGCWVDGKHYPVGSEFWTDNTCTTQCQCLAPASDVVCRSDSCPPKNFCGVVNGVPECSEFTFGECIIYGDPHYYTFDKMTHHFMGICTYTLAKLCSNSSSLPYFNVEAKNEHRGNPTVSYVQKVMVEVYGYHITIVKHEPDRVLLNGIWRTLPIILRNGTLTVTRSGAYILVETDFLLTVSYDTDHTVEVKVPTIYFNQTCGMCGNLNNDYNDEYLMPNGQQAQDTNQFGNSWKVDDDDPTCTPVPPPPPCPPEIEESYKSDAFCGILKSKESPFQVCHSVINPDPFFESCVFDLCILGDDVLCTALESYAAACQSVGVKIKWRNSTFCPRDCPINSHYNECSNACPSTCLNQNASDHCNKPCIEACDCDEGFVLSGSSCVPVSDCGCSYDGTYYEKNEIFWQAECVGRCTCIGNNQVYCTNDSCGPDFACKVQNGVLGCYPADSNICHIYGDPHYITFDGKLYDFQGSCNYTVVETCKNTSQYFSVTARNEHRGSPSWTVLNSVAVRIGNHHIILGKKGIVEVNGVQVSLPYTSIPGISITLNGYVIVKTDFGLEVKFNGDHELIVKVNENFKGQLCGLCGTYNDNYLDDFLKPDGYLAQNPNEFGNSWRVPDDNWICDPNTVDPPPCDPVDEKHYEEQCKLVISSNGPFAACHFFVLPQLYFQSCVYDLCAAGGSLEQFCNALEAYAGACESAGVQLGDWRKDTICAPTPTPVPSCPWTCDFDVDFCSWTQSKLDDFDWIRHKGSTPTPNSGPSFDHTTRNGFYIYIDGRSTSAGQKARLLSPICNSGGHHCLSFWYHMYGVAQTMELNVYVVRNGIEELVWKLTGHQEDTWLPADIQVADMRNVQIILEGVRGNDYRSDVAVDDIFITPGYCLGPSTTTITTTTTTTTSTVKPPPSSGSCVVTGDPHYYTFDNRVFDFMGVCTYTLSKLCQFDKNLVDFNVEAKNEYWPGSTRVSSVRYVNVDVHGYRITLEQNREVKVDGKSVILPTTLPPEVKISYSGQHVMVTTSFGLRVLFDGNHRAEVKLFDTYSNQVCGLCGNFNGNETDDFLNPSGQLEKDPVDLGNSWQVENDTSCPPAIEVIPNCSDDEKIVIGSNNFCGIITNPNGPFKDCHNVIDPVAYFNSCAYDLCELNLDQASLCDSLQSYAVACQSQGVTIQPWRNDTFCPIDCLPNSHYEICSTACPATCVNPGAPSKCDLPCVEGCFCDPGHVLYNDKCVPSLQCGCWDGNNYYPVGSEFWNDDCSTKCRCPSPGSALVCNAATCNSNQYCATINNVSDCIHYQYGICRVNNDPHYNSFDRPVHRFMGLCTYTLSKLCSNSSNLPSFNVEAKNEHRGNPSVTYVQKVIVEVYGYRIQIVRKETSRVLVDGVWVILPVILGGSITVSKSGRYIVLETDFKLQVSYDADHSVEVKIPDTYSNQLCGMCGNFNGQQQDEFQMPNGQQAQNSNELGNSWLVYDEEDPFCSSSPTVPPPEICLPEKELLYQSDTYCGLLTSKISIFSICYSAVDPANYFETCVFDLCALDGDKNVLCSALEVYADACQQEGITIPGWRNITSCELSTCPPNTTYNGCMTACPATCVDPYAPEKCNKPCVEGCECDPGYVISGDICVDASNCGCLYDDKYYNKGDSFLEKDCERKCECQGNNNMVCIETSCAEDEICKVQNGSLGCYPGNEPPSAKPVTIGTTTPTAPIDPCNYTCSFGTDYCGWQQSKQHNLDWIRWYGPTPSDSTGPSSDHSGDGYYLYVDGRDTQWDDTAWLESTECEVQGPNCLRFWYHMYGALEETELNVFVLTKYGLENVASFDEDGGDVWHFHQIELRNNEKIQIIFEGVLRQEDNPFDIAIDDISFVKGYCTAPQPPITTTTTGPSLPPDSSPTATAPPSTTSLITPTDGPTPTTTPEHGSSAGPLTPDPVTHTSTGPETNKTPDTTTPESGSSAGPLTPDPVTHTSAGPETNKTPDTTTPEPGSSAGPLTPDPVTHTSAGPETNKTPDTTTPEPGSSAGPLTPDPVTHTSAGPETNKTPDTTTPEHGSSAGPLTPDPVTHTSTGPETNKTPDTTTPEPGSSAGPLTPDPVTHTSTGPETNKTPDTTTPEPGSSAGPLTPDPVTHTSAGPETNKTPDTTTPEHGSSAGPLTPDPVTHTSAGPETNKTPDTTTPEPGSSAGPLTPDPVTHTSAGPETNKTPDTTTPEPGSSAGPLTPDPVTHTSAGPETNKTPDTTTPEPGSSAGPLTPDPVTHTSAGPETNKTPDTTTPEHGSSAGPLTPDPVTHTSTGPETNKTPDTTTPEPGSSAGPLTPDPVTQTSAGPETNKTPDTTTPEPGSSAGPLTPDPVTHTSAGPETNKTPDTTTPEHGSSAGPLTPVPVTDTSAGPETNKTPDTTTPEHGSSAGPLTPVPVTDTSAGPETNKTPDTTTPEHGSSAGPLTPDPVTDTSTGPETNKTPDLPKTSPGPETASSLSPEPGTVTDKTAGPVSPGPLTKSTPEPETDLTPEPETPTPVTDITTAPVSVTGSPVTDITEGQVTHSIPGSVITRTPSPETASDKVTSTVLDTTVSVTVNTPPGCVTGITESPPANGTAPVTDNTGSPGTDGTPGPATDSTPDIIITSTSAKTTTPTVPPTVPPGYCEVSGDPHYYTFDKQVHHFMGVCTYTLSKLCANDSNLPDFNVEAANDLRNGLTHVSYVQFVNVDVYGYRITLEKVRKVKVNGQPVTLPVSLPPDVEIFLSGTSVFVTTGFGLQVSYDGSHKATVTLPGEYWDKVCGLCGNFNGDKADDFLNPDGNLESDSNSLGNSWQVENDTVCPPAVENKTNCTEDENHLISSTTYCGIITNVNGPFKECHHVIDPRVYFENCVYDLCEMKLDNGTLCDSLQSYADACQSHGVIIQPWRNDTFCPLTCPPNSHYEPCGTSCPSTCVNPHAPNNCSRPCAEGCFCDPGYVLYDTKCVPEDQCGCWQDDKYYPVGDEFWSDDTCSSKCRCPSAGSALVCTEESCLDNQYCGVTNGNPGCYNKPNPGYCEVSGDPHYYTFDKQIHHFMGVCTYTLSKLCANDSNLTDFNVEAANDLRNGLTHVSYVQFVNVDVYGYRITLEKVRKVKVNGQPVTLPESLPPDVEIFLSGTNVFVTTGFGLQVSYDGSHKATISLPAEYANNVCGLCGNFNGDKADDFLNPDGNLEPNSTSLGNSWQVENDTVCPPTDGNNGTCTEDEKIVISSNSYCGMITNENGPFKECHHVVDPEVYFENCVYDLCEVKLDNGTLCDSLQSYADVCQSHGVTVELWRNETFCPFECPQNSHYEPCGTGCPSTCVNPHAPNNCNRPCAEGCFCDPGYILYDNICVPKDQCGCWQDDKYYPVGDEFWSDDTCTSKCRCPSAGSALVCTEESCLDNQYCGVPNGVPECYDKPDSGYCEVSGDPHYYTFDKQVHHFMGLCTYTLSKLCKNDVNLTDFNVEAANDLRNGLTHVSYVQFVNVDVFEYRITLEKVRKVKVNGQPVTLPVSLPPDVEIFLSGTSVFVTTGFGLQVSYDGSHKATVTLPGEYWDNVCGLCGNFNGDKADDFLNPDGNLESDSNSLGNSWQVENDTVCPPAVGNKTNCTEDENDIISSNSYCGMITNENGPFKECHHVIDPEVYFESCVYDLCEVTLDLGTLCDSLQSYADACQSHGVIIQPWRNDTFCPLKCPPNSHYEPCGTSCPSTCVNPHAPNNCSRPCAEGCFCDPGYVLYDTKCVPEVQCGCWQDDKYYPVGDVFWSDDTCSLKCSCPSPGSALVCTEESCLDNQYCGVTNGIPGCYNKPNPGYCEVSGDPHYYTFDKQIHHFMGICTYTLSKLCANDSNLTDFTVEAANDIRNGWTEVSYVQFVNVDVYEYRITLEKVRKVKVNGQPVTPPVSLHPDVEIFLSGTSVFVTTGFGLQVSYDGSHKATVSLPGEYANNVCGLCGNFNGDKADDFLNPDGNLEPNSTSLGNSWQVENDTVCPPTDGNNGTCTEDEKIVISSNSYCGMITNENGPFKECHHVIDPEVYFENCVYDLCEVKLDNGTLCDSLQSYADVCQSHGVTVELWRNETFCPLECPQNSHYEPCGTGCPSTCVNPHAPNNCNRPCAEGCFCDPGYILYDKICVPKDQCGCWQDDKYYPVGDEFWSDDTCTLKCRCPSAGSGLVCTEESCLENQYCGVINGVPGCYDPGYCEVSGDPHYYTFDKQVHHFMGICTYTLSKLCTTDANLTDFTVEAANDLRNGLTHVSYVQFVNVDVYGYRITLEKVRKVKVNGQQVTLPVSLPPDVEIFLSGTNVFVTTGFGLQVSYDGSHRATVTIPGEYYNSVCGLCGNFNGDKADDFLNPDGNLESDSNSLGNSWQVENDTVCPPAVENKTNCTEDENHLISSNTYCGIITNVNGPFKECHHVIDPRVYFENCVYDLCEVKLDNGTLCDSLQSYADACQSHGVTVQPWRNDTFCPLKCPPNSHYEPCGTGCPSTCVNKEAPSKCSRPCAEGCFCDPGYVLYDTKCVPKDQCGCWQDDKYYPVGDEFWSDDTCSSKCRCPSEGSSLVCTEDACPGNQYCGISNGVPGCYYYTFGICRVHNDPHYDTFDKQNHNFMGLCTYTLAKLCDSSSSLPYFNVEAKNQHRGEPSVSFVEWVIIEVYDQHIQIMRNEQNRVLVNKIWRTLPVSLVGGLVTVTWTGKQVNLETDFRLTVSYDTDTDIDVKVPSTYSSLTCGICGNFNNRKKDDFMMPNGQQALTSEELGHSWIAYDEDPLCHPDDPVPPPPPDCTPEKYELYKSDGFCGLLTSKDGPFYTCNSVISPGGFFESCIFDLCALDGDKDILCSLLGSYAAACQKEGLTLNWRNSTGCEPTCQNHSHYNPCMSACPATCLNLAPTDNCSLPCTEGCECDDGYVLSGGTCVHESSCGCLYNGTYYSEGEIFVQGNCENSCTCKGNNNMECHSISCAKDEICKVQNGTMGCYAPSTAICHIYGDPHYYTFDGTLHHFQGSCTYTVTETCENTSNNFIVTTRNEHRGNPDWTAINSVALTVDGLHILLEKNNMVLINGTSVTLPVTVSGISIVQNGQYVKVTADFGLELEFNGDHELFVKVKENYKGTLCGLCGTYNENRNDDFMTPNGTVVSDVNEFGSSWRVPDDNWICDDTPPSPPTCSPPLLQEAQNRCWILKQIDGPFRSCHSYIQPHGYFESCVFDQCVTGGSNEQLCNVLASYAAICESKGVSLEDWKNNTICDPTITTTTATTTGVTTTTTTTPGPTTRTPTTTTGDISSDASCSASGDPHYNTFDGAVHHYMGNCSYTLSKPCNASSAGLPDFHVYTTNEHRDSNTQVSYVQSVHIEISKDEFTILKNKKFNINGRRSNLPMAIKNSYSAYINGNYLVFETDFGLRVRFDGNHYVDISLPSIYKGHLCGLCGNYNGISGDDNVKNDGSMATDSMDLGDSWIVSSDETQCGSQDLDVCDPLLREEYSRNTACGIIKDNTGIFKNCHALVNPDNFFENCVLDMCFTESKSTSLCYAVQAYAQQCANAGVCTEWRSATFCPLSCPGGSHYQTCGTGCPATCHNLLSETECKASTVEGCFCDEGYVLSGDRCVKESECGCTDSENNSYQLGESWFAYDDCSERCTCNQNNAISCTPWKCGVLEKCESKDGVLGCQSSGRASCHVSGDPHFFTFDKVMHSFMGTCTYTILQVCDTQNVIPVTISGKTEERGQRAASYLKEVYIDIYGIRITLQKARKMMVENQQIQTPWSEHVRGVSIGTVGLYSVVETDFGLIAKFDGDHYLEIILPESYFGKVCGMCGNYNGRQDDEYLLPNGLQAINVTHFGNSWKSEKDSDKNCVDDGRQDLGPPCKAAQLPAIENQCNVLLSDTFKPCHHLIDPQPFVKSCVYDMCRYNGMQSTLCAIVQGYVGVCMTHGVKLKWRSNKLCPLSCPSHSHYTDCASLCPATCNDIYASAVCDKPEACTEGCVCNDGYVLSGDKCVSLKKCGCRDSKNNYFNVDETWLTSNCKEVCSCNGAGKIICKPHGCSHGKCGLNNGKYNCKPTGYAKCHITGDPHHNTFDRLTHHFQGKESYVLTQTSSVLPDLLQPFSIEGKNEPMNKYSKFTLIREMRIKVYNHTIIFSQKKKLVLDGVKTSPPIKLKEGIHIYQRPSRIHLETDFGLSVSFDGNQNAEITVPNTHKNVLEGLCGNYDGRSSNDFRRPDGSQVRDVVSFGESWKVKSWKSDSRIRRDIGLREEEDILDLDTGDNLACSASELAHLNSTSFCGMLRDTNGPFETCHALVDPEVYITNCLFDTCAEFRNIELFCSNLEQYSLACQDNGTTLDGWRERAGCDLPCGPNSEYSKCMNACPASCSNMASEAECEAPCYEGCQCSEGYILSDFECVPYKECGCTYLDKYYQYGEVFMTDDCTQNCTCTDTVSVVCSNTQCESNEICTTANGIRGCYIPGPCLENPCENGGTCVEGTMNSTYMNCVCPESYSGEFCEAEEKKYDNSIIYIVIGVVVGVLVIGFFFVFAAFCFFRNQGSKKHLLESHSSEDGSVSLSRISVNPGDTSIYNEPDLINLAFEEDFPQSGAMNVTNNTNVKTSDKRTSEQKSADNAKASEQTTTRHNQTQF